MCGTEKAIVASSRRRELKLDELELHGKSIRVASSRRRELKLIRYLLYSVLSGRLLTEA